MRSASQAVFGAPVSAQKASSLSSTLSFILHLRHLTWANLLPLLANAA